MPESKLPDFRKEAIAELNTPEQLDQLIQVVSPRAWLILNTSYILIALLVIWGLFGSIPTRVEGQGLLLAEGGSVYNAVATAGGGRVVKILVKAGDHIKKQAVLAELERPDLMEKLILSINYIGNLKQEVANLKQDAERETRIRAEDFQRQRILLENTLAIEMINQENIQKLLDLKDSLFKQGIVALQDLETTRRDFYGSKQRASQIQIQIEQLKTQEDDFKHQWQQRITEKELLVLSEALKTDSLQAEVEAAKKVTSPTDGVIISINTSIGKRMEDGGSVASIASLGKGLDAVVFMQPKEGQQVRPGMKALVAPKNIQKEEYGSMKATVLHVSSFPEAGESILAVLNNPELTKSFIEKGAPTAVWVRVKQDPRTVSGYLWSSSKGPQEKITPGMLADIRITVREQPPFSLIIPMFKKLLGVS